MKPTESVNNISYSLLIFSIVTVTLAHSAIAETSSKSTPPVNETNTATSTLDAQIIQLEKKVFGQASPPGKSVEERLLSLEDRLFGKFNQGTPAGLFNRLERLRTEIARSATTISTTEAKSNSMHTNETLSSGSTNDPSLPTILTSPSTSTTDIDPSKLSSATVTSNAYNLMPPSSENSSSKETDAQANANPEKSDESIATPSDTAGSVPKSAPPSGPLVDAKAAFDKSDFKTARHLVEGYIQKNPLDSHGYYLLATIDLKEKALSLEPQYDQFAYDQFLKGYYLNDKDSDCSFACAFVARVEIKLNSLDRRLATLPIYLRSNPNVLLNAGVNLFRRGHDKEARELFDFAIKNAPGCMAGALYNEGAMAERQGNIQAALNLYKAAGKAIKDRNSLMAAGMLKLSDTDGLTESYLQYAISHASAKLAEKKPTWDGEGPDPEALLSTRSLIMTLTAMDARDPLSKIPIMQTEVPVHLNHNRIEIRNRNLNTDWSRRRHWGPGNGAAGGG